MRIVFMGTESFGIPAIQKLREAGHTIAGIVTTPARPQGRGLKPIDSEIAKHASNAGFWPILTPEILTDCEFLLKLKMLNADLFIVVAYRILPNEVFCIPLKGTINIHASLLPAYRGPAPIERAIESGETRTGITIFRIDEGVDTGGIILQKESEIGMKETASQLYDRLSHIGAESLIEAINMIEAGQVKYVPQDEARASRAPKLKKQEALLDWSKSCTILFNRVRAFKPFPGTYTMLGGRRLAIEWAEPRHDAAECLPGTVYNVSAQWFDVCCGQGGLRVLEVKPEGKKRMAAMAFMHGTKIARGTVLG
jgi:methionyl-tRNA formyltransferase